MIRTLITVAGCAVLLAGCMETTGGTEAAMDPLTAAVKGKKLVSDDATFVAHADGRLTGNHWPTKTEFDGTWEVENGQWCRDFTKPEKWKGRKCQDAWLNADGTLTIDGASGPLSYRLE